MIHYHVWFDLKPEIAEADGLATVRRFLAPIAADGEALDFELLRNKGRAPRSKLASYHALIRFADDAQLDGAMRRQVARGVHAGAHGDVIDVVTNFHVEIFSTIAVETVSSDALCACEI